MRILLSNDDGYLAQGLQTLATMLRKEQHEVYIFAPNTERSGQSHAMSFFRPLVTRQIDPFTTSIEGTPADCVALALHHFLKQNPPDLVLSGINHGLNVGWDVNYSGTVGAATEACLLGFKAIAISTDLPQTQDYAARQPSFDRAAALTCKIIAQLDRIAWPTSEIMNINHPSIDPKGVVQASCAGYSMYIPLIKETADGVFTIGGSERVHGADPSADVTLVQQGFATLSFLMARQSSSSPHAALDCLLERVLCK